jgi:hypothetical protein
MGLINNDTFTASNGVQKTGTYISFNNETIYLRKGASSAYMMPPSTVPSTDDTYMVNANYRVFWDKDAKDAGKSFIELRNVSAAVTLAQLDSNLYGILYEELKKQYPNTVDDLRTAEPVAAAVAEPVATSDATATIAAATPVTDATNPVVTPSN